MPDVLELYGFGLNDRSSKVRWLCHELGITIQERRLELGAHREPPYSELNPYGMVPTIVWQGHTMIESTAICTFIAEQHRDSQLVVAPGEPERAEYLQWVALFAETLESRLVEHLLAQAKMIPEAFVETTTSSLELRLPVMIERLPQTGFLVADRFTLADIEACYSLRLGIRAGLIERARVAGYLEPLVAREAARSSGFFSSIQD